MIINKLIKHHIKHGDDDVFYTLQADDAIRWIRQNGISMLPTSTALDLATGCGIFGHRLAIYGVKVTFSDHHYSLREWMKDRNYNFQVLKIGEEPLAKLGKFDLVICSNLIEHLPDLDAFIAEIPSVLNSGGILYLSWTNWFSPWGGHDFSPWHYFGTYLGPRIYDLIHGKSKRDHFPYAGLWPTHIGSTLRKIAKQPRLKVIAIAPRYYTEYAWLMKIPILREFLAWNCAILIQKTNDQ